jgi:hypothetical protein
MGLVENLAVRELTADEVRELVVPYAGQAASPDLDAVKWTKETLTAKFLAEAPEGSRFFVLDWYGYATPLDVEVGNVIIIQTRHGKLQARRDRLQMVPDVVGAYVRLEGRGFEGYDQHKMLTFLHPSALASASVKCPRCGSEQRGDSNYCDLCGQPLKVTP